MGTLVNQSETFEGLVTRGYLSRADYEEALTEALKSSKDLENVFMEGYEVSKADLGQTLSDYYKCPFIEFTERTIVDPELLKNLNIDYLKKNHWVPLRRTDNTIDVLIDDPHDLDKGLDIRRAFPVVTIRYAVGTKKDIELYLLSATGQLERESIGDILGDLANEAGQDPNDEPIIDSVDENHNAIVRLASQIIAEGYRAGASDIHIEPYNEKKETVVRFRVDGTCSTYMKIPPTYRRAIVSRFKIMANLDIAERRKPQDGKIRFKQAKEHDIELRVATLPTAGGNEDVVMRILTSKLPVPLEKMDFSQRVLKEIKGISERPYGIILCVGPTGSGKTTTLHALLAHINTDERKIWTAEDPVEITQEGLRQVQVHPKIGLNFATAMRSFLRADPDVIMIGEMRDKETADIAIEASLTGHLVLSTLHTNSAVETITRLLDLGCDSFNFADAMLGVISKRLCKKICSNCKESYHPSKEEYDELAQVYGKTYWPRLGVEWSESFQLHRGRGCQLCHKAGFRGRIALHELLLGSEEIKALIQSKARTHEMQNLALEQGMITLVQDGVEKVLQGLTTFQQVRRVAIK